MMMRLRLVCLLLVAAAMTLLGACGDDEEAAKKAERTKLVVYSGRAEELVGPLLARFEREAGVDLEVRYGESAELAATLAEEGGNTPADVFYSQDAGALGAVAEAGLLSPLPRPLLERVPPRFSDSGGRWVGVSGRARVVAYSSERLEAGDLPDSIFDFTSPRWKGRIGFPPSNASFQAFVSAMRVAVGDERTRGWLDAIKRNDPTLLENNLQTEEAIAAGEVDVGFVNHYYVYEIGAERPDFPVANHFLRAGDPGALVNAAGVGVLADAGEPAAARRLVEFLLGRSAQEFFAQKTFEYPLVDGVATARGLRPLSQVQGPDIRLGDLGEKLPSTLEMLSEAGLTS